MNRANVVPFEAQGFQTEQPQKYIGISILHWLGGWEIKWTM